MIRDSYTINGVEYHLVSLILSLGWVDGSEDPGVLAAIDLLVDEMFRVFRAHGYTCERKEIPNEPVL